MSTVTALAGLGTLATAGTDNPAADFSDTPMWLSLVKALIIFVYLLVSTLLVIWFERRVIGRMQQRPGPNRNGPFGLLQTLADGMKSMLKEDVRPKASDAFVFTLAPIITATMCFVSFSIMPLAGEVSMFGHTTPFQLTDTPVAVLLVLAVAGIGIYGVVLAGWSSGSPYPLMGGLRASAQMISYEIAMGLSLVAVFLYAGSMSTSQIVAAQAQNMWFVIPAFFSFFVYVITMVGETNRLPFDLAEGEGELTGGFHTEYGSMRFAMFFLGEYINMFTVAALATTMFLGGPQAPPGIAAINGGMFNEGWWGVLWFTAKLWAFMFVFVWLRGSLPRVRYDQFMRFGWKFLIPTTLGWVVLVAFFRAGQNGWLGGNIDFAGRSFPAFSLALVGIIAVAALVGGWLWDSRAERKEASLHPSVPTEIDPYAGGHPVPPMPGQRLREPSFAPALTARPETEEATRG
ncbi:NADH-quinone oxidoreductase subunit NuoH [Arthrobacter sp. NEB 688]|uniref:NADH-quinone oxidoreductase subunit NuoH n=1 Tax=Arthrobacter sp. NEB 688 TaxID=904039 RepID=UPI00156581C6|nr:NADH-quinone oxidoreductase subunit NuoH [Arthrobacter sp. NEB 688]QKE83734.1 NADH-quinone oxidoreductase subunit NuoH [Arthrobacter sp. NEB 688]